MKRTLSLFSLTRGESSIELASHFFPGVFLFCFSNVYSTFLFVLKGCRMDCFDCFHDMQMDKDFKKCSQP